MVTPDHDQAVLRFRLLNANGFDIVKHDCRPRTRVGAPLLDELAKLLVGRSPIRFV